MANVIYAGNIGKPVSGQFVPGGLASLLVAAYTSISLVGADAVDADSTRRDVFAAGHAARPGDIVVFTSGALSGVEVMVEAVATNSFTVSPQLSVSPAIADTFEIFRFTRTRVTSNGTQFVAGVSGIEVRETRIHDASVVNINNNIGAFVEVETAAAIGAFPISRLQVSYTAGEPLQFRLGADAAAAAAANDLFVINQGEGPTTLDVNIPAGSRLWVRSFSATAVDAGYITLNLMG